MKKIPLTKGKYALVDDEDFEWLNQWKWTANYNGNWYAVRRIRNKGVQTTVYMHRLVLELNTKDKRIVDHIDHNTLDNRKCNLRVATKSENAANCRSHKRTTSKFKGVYWKKKDKKWCAAIRVQGESRHLGLFKLEKLAALAYDMAATKYFGVFAKLNFPEMTTAVA